MQLAVVMDLPLTILNLWLLWMVEPELIKSALFLTSLIIAVFSAGKISTLIEYHLELRQRKRKLERLLLVRLWFRKRKEKRQSTQVCVCFLSPTSLLVSLSFL